MLILGTVVFSVVTDRGHDPMWRVAGNALVPQDPDTPVQVASVAVSPTGDRTYALLAVGSHLEGVVALDAAGERAWFHEDLGKPVGVSAAGDAGFAYATPVAADSSQSHVIVLSPAGDIIFQESFNVTVRALALDGNDVVVALQAPGNPVSIHHDLGARVTTREFDSFVNALDFAGGTLAVGTGTPGTSSSTLTAIRENETIVQAFLDRPIRSVRLSANGSLMVASGGDLAGGFVAAYDTQGAGSDFPILTFDGFRFSVPFVEVAGGAILAVEETPGRGVIHYWGTAQKSGSQMPDWSWSANGLVTRDALSRNGGARLSPDGRFVAVATSDGDLVLLDGSSEAVQWRYRTAGSTSLAFAQDNPSILVVNGRSLANQPFDAVARFSLTEEPFLRDRVRFLSTFLAFEIVVGAVALSLMYAREWRPNG